MISEEVLNGVLDIVQSILGVKSQNAEILLTYDGKIIFRVDRASLYVIDTNMMFVLPKNIAIKFSKELEYLDEITFDDLTNVYFECVQPYPLAVKYENVQDDELFNELTGLKSKDGLRYYDMYDQNHNVYKIPMFTGFIKVNKGDKVDIEVYDLVNFPYLMNKFIVRKKKLNYPVQVYFKTIKF